ncbi:hypothetical protein [Microcoleus vaginatus]|uniref:hypothetical protein n=1 Tax=Microcoleus vaginatus TaxID=119532 RepID=UPI001686F242|nr:hypothetical protein [Microcoleus sp. FACHB-DQ6]MBD1885668.1 hypothetical protein [Microcoleus sp. FACHB-84]MBD2008797.1 hypothetical protein [Microcoleus sp. FACHB-45]
MEKWGMGRGEEWEKGRVGDGKNLPSSFSLLPDIRYIRPCESVAELPSSFFLLPSSFFLLPSSFFLLPS